MSEKKSGETILAFLLGGAIGACLGLLFAPKSGKETRKKVKMFFDEISEKTGEIIEEGKDKIEELVHSSKTIVKK
ncbi:MAG: hypothetical protein A2539_08780 [Elusimicrobia bacterium RIFOXYD2_FULL_34_15]|nr:MAG: hypothetical protein A2539_08780 [Elusimicrobia bacterium RIFOXYD2_FULL_34_15]